MVVYGANTWTCNDGIFKQRVHNAHSVGTKAALGNCLPYNLDTANKHPMTSMLTKPAGEKKYISMQEANEGLIFASLLPNQKKMSWQN